MSSTRWRSAWRWRRKFIYDLWGDTVNTASRMESQGLPGEIQVTARAMERLRDRFALMPRGRVEVKGKGPMETYLLRARKPANAPEEPAGAPIEGRRGRSAG